MKKLIKCLTITGLMFGLVGCASVDTISKRTVENNKVDGVLYGVTTISKKASDVKMVCDAINNKDEKCLHQNDFFAAKVLSRFGFSKGEVGAISLVRKDISNVDKLTENHNTGDDGANFVKVILKSGKLGEIVEIASKDHDGKCNWSGLPRAGGVVCPAFNYDYNKDFTGVVLSTI